MVQHPNSNCNISQAEFLANCPEDQRRFHELLFSYGNSAYIYHEQANNFSPSSTDYEEWLEGLKGNMRQEMQQKGFKKCKNILSFTRYVLEKNDIGMTAFILDLMGKEDFTEMQAVINKNTNTNPIKY